MVYGRIRTPRRWCSTAAGSGSSGRSGRSGPRPTTWPKRGRIGTAVGKTSPMSECDPRYYRGVQSEWPLVGRTEELARLIRDLVEGRRGVVLAGLAGVGKTRLASEALEHCRRAGLATARVSATRAGAGIPLGAFASLLPTTRGPQRGAVDDRAHLLHECAVALAERAAGRRLVLSVDDAHLLDDMSATLVHQLAETGGATLLVTYRCTEPAPDPVMALWKDGLVERVELDGLGINAVRDVLTA